MTDKFILKRLLALPFLVLGTATIVFFATRLLPGDPATLFLSPSFPPDLTQHLRAEFGLDRSLGAQYLLWLGGILSGNLGSSFAYHRGVLPVIADALPYTISLAFCSIVVQIVGGVAVALAAARYNSTSFGRTLSIASLLTYTLPTFSVAYVLLQVFSYRLGLFPSSHIHSVDAAGLSGPAYAGDYIYNLILPVLTLAIPGAAGIARFLRT